MKRIKINIFIVIFIFAISILIIIFFFPLKYTTKDYIVKIYFDGAYLTDYRGEDKDVIIPNYIGFFPVTTIDRKCFEYKDTIETVIIPNNVRNIKPFAFSGCVNLKSVEASRIKSIGLYSFADDCQLEKVNLGDNLQTIGENAFEGCGMLTYIPSKDSVKEIGDHAFKGCEIEDPGDLTGITVGEDAFVDCPWSESPNNPVSENYVDPEEDSEE